MTVRAHKTRFFFFDFGFSFYIAALEIIDSESSLAANSNQYESDGLSGVI